MFQELNISDLKEKTKKLFDEPINIGVPFLNSACPIAKSDLVVISAHTGLGKTELAALISMEAVKQNKRVCFFALEAFEYEIETRNIFRMVQQSYQKSCDDKNQFTRVYFSYDMYLRNDIPEQLKPYVEDAENYIRTMSKNLRVVYREKSDYTIDHFCNDLTDIDLDTDLIIIDHLHFFDYDETKEYSEISKIVKKLRDLPLITEIPIVLVSHLRKNVSKNQKPVPTIDDLHGSSNIAKVASKIIFISPDFKTETKDNYNFSTLVRVAKNRYNGQVTRFVGLLKYNTLTNTYSKDFEVGKLNYYENDYDILENKPGWCK